MKTKFIVSHIHHTKDTYFQTKNKLLFLLLQNLHFGRPDIVKKIYQFSDGFMEENDDLENVDSHKDSQTNQVVSPAVDPVSKITCFCYLTYCCCF